MGGEAAFSTNDPSLELIFFYRVHIMYTTRVTMRNSVVSYLSSLVKTMFLMVFLILGHLLGFEKTTFDIMWDLSKPNGDDAEESFLRVPQTIYYRDDKEKVDVFEQMPNVSSKSQYSSYPAEPVCRFTFLLVSTTIRK